MFMAKSRLHIRHGSGDRRVVVVPPGRLGIDERPRQIGGRTLKGKRLQKKSAMSTRSCSKTIVLSPTNVLEPWRLERDREHFFSAFLFCTALQNRFFASLARR